MAKLTEQLISEFVQTTTPKTDDRNHEFTVTGTVISIGENGVVNVRMDGGEEAPCQSTVGCAVDDRVIVSFKNREPVVTSNITSPTTSVAQLNAEVANINTVMAQKATITYVDTQTVNAVNVFATNGTFTGTLSAAKGTFTGTVTFDYNVAGGKEHISIGPDNQSEPIEISMNQASGESFKVGIDRSGISIKHHQAYDNRDFTTNIGSTGINISGTNAGYCSIGLNGVSTDSGSRLISSSEISAISSHTSTLSSHTSSINALKSWVKYQKTTQSVTLAGGAKSWITPNKPTDTNYNWYLLSCASHNSIHVLHLSQTGAYLYNTSSSSITHNDTGWYWLGIHK